MNTATHTLSLCFQYKMNRDVVLNFSRCFPTALADIRLSYSLKDKQKVSLLLSLHLGVFLAVKCLVNPDYFLSNWQKVCFLFTICLKMAFGR